MFDWISLDLLIGFCLALVLVIPLAIAKHMKGRFRRKQVRFGKGKVYFVTIDRGKSWFQAYWDEKGFGHIMLEPDQEAAAVLVKKITEKEKRHKELMARRDEM